MKKRVCDFRKLVENAKEHYHLGTKVEKGVPWEASGIPWDELGKPWGPKSSPELTF